MKDFTVIIDLGHSPYFNGSYRTPGKRGTHPDLVGKLHDVDANGRGVYYEGHGNRYFGFQLASQLQLMGYTACVVNGGNLGDMPLHERCRIVDNTVLACNDRCVFVSVHSNAADRAAAKGFTVWTLRGQDDANLSQNGIWKGNDSDLLASRIWQSMEKAAMLGVTVGKDMADGDVDKEGDFAVLLGRKCPSVLIENLFMTNAEDVQLLMSKLYCISAAGAWATGIDNFVQERFFAPKVVA